MDTVLSTLDPAISAVRPHLQPLTKNLPGPVRDAISSLLGDACYKRLVVDIKPTSECASLAISKALGIGIVSMSAIVKLPQLLKIINSKSAEGLSFPSYLLETSAFAISLAYSARNGFPFSTYGENALVAVQNVIIAALILHLGGKSAGAAAFVGGAAAAGYALANDSIVNMGMLSQLMAGAGALGMAAKVPQIYTIWQQGGTGQLSAFAVSPPCSNLQGCLLSSRNSLICWCLGLHVSLWITGAYLHDLAGSSGQDYLVYLLCCLHPQCGTRFPNAVLLEQFNKRATRW